MQNVGERTGELVPGGGRNVDTLKEEVQRRANHDLPPLTGIGAEKAVQH